MLEQMKKLYKEGYRFKRLYVAWNDIREITMRHQTTGDSVSFEWKTLETIESIVTHVMEVQS